MNDQYARMIDPEAFEPLPEGLSAIAREAREKRRRPRRNIARDTANAIAESVREESRITAQCAPTPVAWVIPGDDNARENGFIDAMAWQEGEFTRPLYALTSTERPDPTRLPPAGCLCRNDFERSHCAYEKRGECTRVPSTECGPNEDPSGQRREPMSPHPLDDEPPFSTLPSTDGGGK